MLKPAAIFSDNMVLQHGKPVLVWGTGGAGSVCVKWISENNLIKTESIVCKTGWSVQLPPLAAGQHGELVISDENSEIKFKNVITGDVWFAGGQSNMEMEIVNCKNGSDVLTACKNNDIRFYQVVKRAVVDDNYLQEEAESAWQVCAPDTASMLSAVAYFFAQKLNKDIKIPIGIINCSWGGTSISAWVSKKQLEKSRAGQQFIDDYNAKINGKTEAQYNAEMEKYYADWRAWDESVRLRKEIDPDVSQEILNKECGQCPWPQPAGLTSPYCPTNLHTARIRRTAPYTIRGFIYYQGEEDDQRATDYRQMMYYLVQQWRSDWSDDNLPFLFVQLPMYASSEEMLTSNLPRHWCLMRENQYLASLDIKNTGLAVIIDCGEFDNIHPLDKQTVGYRLALQALEKVYGWDIKADSPVYDRIEFHGNELFVYFINAENGLEFRQNSNGFEIAEEEGQYYPACAEIKNDVIILRSEKVSLPKRARYAWVKYGLTPLYEINGLPVMPFRTNKNEPADC
jgi:sialate O-acetylesterase